MKYEACLPKLTKTIKCISNFIVLFIILFSTGCRQPQKKQTKFHLKDYYTDNEFLSSKTDSIFLSLSNIQRIGQMFVINLESDEKSFIRVKKLISSDMIGGVAIFSDHDYNILKRIAQLEGLVQDVDGVPLLFSIDAEPNLLESRIKTNIGLPNTADIQTVGLSQNVAKTISSKLLQLGIQQNYAPVCDNGANHAVINTRAFGGNPEMIKELATVFIKETQQMQILATAKHFPGHGLISGDTHKGEVVINGRLKELGVFKHIIDNDVMSIMVGHITVENNNKYATNGLPSSLSRIIVTNLLREELGFEGLIITDALNMKAVSKFKNIAYQSIMAGNDIILMTNKLENDFDMLKERYKNDTVFKVEVDGSIKRIIRAKICLGLFENVEKKPIAMQRVYLSGHISKYPIEMILDINRSLITGTYRYQNNSILLDVSGVMRKDSSITLYEFDQQDYNTGCFDGRLVNGQFNGNWTSTKNTKLHTFLLSKK